MRGMFSKSGLWGKRVFCLAALSGAAFLVLVARGDYPDIRARLENFPVLSGIISQRDSVKKKAALVLLNQNMPASFRHLFDTAFRGAPADRRKFASYGGYINYYTKVTEVFPESYEAYNVLGFCFAQTGSLEKAEENFIKAAGLKDDFFAARYNLGVLNFLKKEYAAAGQNLKSAVSVNPVNTIKQIYSSKIYRQIIGSGGTGFRIKETIMEGYADGNFILGLSLKALGKDRQAETFLRRALKGPGIKDPGASAEKPRFRIL